ncbi:MAG: hypothetical protein CL840_01615 [Crocinitomicaceae bacterium]|nr:hypothetical protein [Crocinitomicaceae bacterium]|tara:strand:- start:5776 stop:6795 length:1020 start_codon:yes stop_codon:yes gene_type:complete
MKIVHSGIIMALLLGSIQSVAQSEFKELIKEGVQYHDAGDYDNAIESYKQALKIDPNSALANYELALTYFTMGEYKQAIKYSDAVLEQNVEYMIQAYMTKGSALDMLGKTKESIKLLEKALNKTEGHYLLYYNLALNYFKLNDLDKAEENVINAVQDNPSHSSSHLMLALIHDQKGNKVQTILASHYFLLLEPNSKRSSDAYEMLQRNFGGNVSTKEGDPNTINIMVSPNNDTQFAAAELMISMLEASKSIEENKGKTDDEMFVENTESFFKIMGELREDKNKDIWWRLYTPFFYEIAKSDHLETYCKYITQGNNANSRKWLEKNETRLQEFAGWMKKQ